MEVKLAATLRGTDGEAARAIVERCVHCGFCNATCPTYQLLGDELDGPRGRIYLIKQVLEGATPTTRTQEHLDRCLTCRACETTCPSGVEYGRLLDIGREMVEERVPRAPLSRWLRSTLRRGLTSRRARPLLRLLQAARPGRRAPAGAWPTQTHARRMLLLEGCVQPAMFPNINAATARVLDAAGIELLIPRQSGCCGALRHHLNDHPGALADARRNIDAWWPAIEAGAEAIVMNASGCGAMVKEYAHLLRHDPAYASRARRVVELTRDISSVVADNVARGAASPRTRIAFHAPCTLQHAQRIRGTVEALLTAFGAELVPVADAHLCCGSAGTYSLLQPRLARQLRTAKLQALLAGRPSCILSANVGCIGHLGAAARIPVLHWIEWLDARLAAAGASAARTSVEHQLR
jgi:glycolate oxidase iron-sulfur subunit